MGKSRWKGKRKMAFIKNIDHETVLNLADQIHAEPGQDIVVTKYLGMEGTGIIANEKEDELKVLFFYLSILLFTYS